MKSVCARGAEAGHATGCERRLRDGGGDGRPDARRLGRAGGEEGVRVVQGGRPVGSDASLSFSFSLSGRGVRRVGDRAGHDVQVVDNGLIVRLRSHVGRNLAAHNGRGRRTLVVGDQGVEVGGVGGHDDG